jgi:hypothetical protein
VSETIRIVPVQTKAQWRDFHHLPFKVYQGDPHWVAPLLLERHSISAQAQSLFPARPCRLFPGLSREWRACGRITAQIDQLVRTLSTPPVISASSRPWTTQDGLRRLAGAPPKAGCASKA